MMGRMHRLPLRFLFALLAIGVALGAQSLHVPGLQQAVTIRRDRWGIAHIYAQNEHDLFFAQGYNVAHERLFQLEMWRRQATGTLAEVLGPSAVDRDWGNRLFQYRGDLTQELNWYHPHGAAIVQAFVDGINAYIARTQADPSLLSPDFALLHLKPGLWTPAVVISRFNGLLANVNTEINLAQAVRAIGAKRVDALEYFQPDHPDLTLDPSLNDVPFGPKILAVYNAFRRPLRITPGDLQAANSTAPPTPFDLERQLQTIGSNNWVVSGGKTADGHALMANDPHRTQEAPSLRFWVHLVAPGWDVIGAGEPALPGVSIGHNQFGAWGLTIFGGDSEDLYVYRTNPANPNQYRYRGQWEAMHVLSTTIEVKGAAPVVKELKYTRHGPVVYEDPVLHLAYAVRAAWLQPGSAPYLASLRMDQARNWQEFRAACAFSRVPSENMVWAGVNGDIGYQAVGITPRRPNWSGLLPVPGDGRYEWNGYLPIPDLPHTLNPAAGFFNTSNNYLIPPGWNHPHALHYQWADSFRADRVAEVLRSGQGFSVADMEALQNDDVSLPARALVPLLRGLQVQGDEAGQARNVLLGWNDRLDKTSQAAAMYEAWQRQLSANLRLELVPEAARPYIGQLSLSREIAWFQAHPHDPALATSLEQAVTRLNQTLGPDLSQWRWGLMHHARIFHVLSPALTAAQQAEFDVGSAERSGGAVTVDATGAGPNQTAGGSFKIIADTGDWDASVGINNPGQSGDPRSPHYRDLYALWSVGRYFPINYSLPKVESVTEAVLQLRP